jgi:hypothetical protein
VALTVKFGIWIPYSEAKLVTRLARMAEQCGWDGIFIREFLIGMDSWIPIAAAALSTQEILIGGVVSPFSEQNPRQVLREAYKIHRKSNRRLIVCLGDWYQESVERHADSRLDRQRADRISYEYVGGKGAAWFAARLTIWRVGHWPDKQSILAAIKNQGVIPVARQSDSDWRSPTIQEIRAISDYVQQVRGTTQGFEIVVEVGFNGISPQEKISNPSAWAKAGATWWIINGGRSVDGAQNTLQMERTIQKGPPQVGSGE